MPENNFKRTWNLIIALLLVYTAVFVPIRVAFFDEVSTFVLILETMVDSVFIADIVLTFFTAIEKLNTIEVRHSKIASEYLKSWFWFDLVASIPW